MRFPHPSRGPLVHVLVVLALVLHLPCRSTAAPGDSRMTALLPSDRSVVAAHAALPNGAPLLPEAVLLLISVRDQRLLVARGGTPIRSYAISTAKAGTGSEADSGRTPLGWHRVTDWIGGKAAPGQVFVSRQPVGGIIPRAKWCDPAGADRVMTRVLWLDGMEEGINRGPGIDSRSRFIYLHGTNQEHLIGRPASHGCIRLTNRDVMELYDLTVGRPTYCLILPSF